MKKKRLDVFLLSFLRGVITNKQQINNENVYYRCVFNFGLRSPMDNNSTIRQSNFPL